MKLCRSKDKTLSYYVKSFSLPKNKTTHFVFASEIYHCSILLKIERKNGKYFIIWQKYLYTTCFLQNNTSSMYFTFVEAVQRTFSCQGNSNVKSCRNFTKPKINEIHTFSEDRALNKCFLGPHHSLY